MAVSMMGIRRMHMIVYERLVAMPVRMGLTRGDAGPMLVSVMLVMLMQVLVLQLFVYVKMAVSLAQQQRYAKRHRSHRSTFQPAQL